VEKRGGFSRDAWKSGSTRLPTGPKDVPEEELEAAIDEALDDVRTRPQ
jgi:hypothetical protein